MFFAILETLRDFLKRIHCRYAPHIVKAVAALQIEVPIPTTKAPKRLAKVSSEGQNQAIYVLGKLLSPRLIDYAIEVSKT